MKRNKHLKASFTLVMALCLILPMQIFSQGYAGPDKSIINGESTTIGGGNCPNCCYTWSPDSTLSDPNVANPTANPKVTATYTLKVVGDNFTINDVDQVTVTVEDGLSAISAVPKKCCWRKGDPISMDQFTVTTTPPGLEGSVTLSPTSVPTNIFASAQSPLTVTFTGQAPNGTPVTGTATIQCVDEDAKSQATAGMGQLDIASIIKYCDDVINNVKMGPCNASGTPSVNVTFATGKLCCAESGCIKDFYEYVGSYNYDATYTCDFPFAGVPYVASLNARLMVGAGIALYLGNVKTTCEGVDVCYSLNFTGSLGGGISGTLLGGKLVDVSLLVVATLSTEPLEYCIPSGKFSSPGSICAQADVVGTVVLFSWITKQVKVPLISKKCW